MAFGNIFFIFVFLPLSLILYFAVPQRLPKVRNIVLVLVSLLFYSWGKPSYLILLMFSILFNYFSALEIDYYQKRHNPLWAKIMMLIAVVGNLLMLGFFKYFGFLLEIINGIFHTELKIMHLGLPLGISFYTFTVLSYIFDVYYEKESVEKDFISYTLYVTFFPKLVSGPIVAYRDMKKQLYKRRINPYLFGRGVNMFLVGLGKKVLIADNLSIPFNAIRQMSQMSILTAWLGAVFYSLELYFDFSGYSDMAIGLATMFGFRFEKNFDYPYMSDSISDFWRRWHASLGSWFRNYVYFPMGGSRCSRNRQLLNLSTVWLLTGIWHGASWNFIVWGIWHGVLVITEKFIWGEPFKKLPRVARILITDLMAVIGWVWFFTSSLTESLHFLGQMFGAGHMGLWDSSFFYYFSTNAILFLIALIGSFPLLKKLHMAVVYRSRKRSLVIASVIGYAVLLFLCMAYLINNTYTSFLYFQF